MDIFNILVRGQWTDQWTPIERSLDMVIVHNVTNVHNGHPQPFLLHFYPKLIDQKPYTIGLKTTQAMEGNRLGRGLGWVSFR